MHFLRNVPKLPVALYTNSDPQMLIDCVAEGQDLIFEGLLGVA